MKMQHFMKKSMKKSKQNSKKTIMTTMKFICVFRGNGAFEDAPFLPFNQKMRKKIKKR